MSSAKPFVCEYCGTGYVKEKTLVVHVCEQKRRALQKTEKRVQYGFHTFIRFYELSMGSKKRKTYEEFCKSQYYNAFVKFGSFITNVNPLYPEKYIEWVIKSGVKLDHWTRDSLYEKYVLELVLKEDMTVGVERSIKTMMAWAEEKESVYNHYFKYVSTNRAVQHIKDGKISPWIILNCTSGQEMLGTFNDEQLELVYHVINPQHWAMRFKKHKSDVELVKEIAKTAGL